jgi:hypothetical protein
MNADTPRSQLRYPKGDWARPEFVSRRPAGLATIFGDSRQTAAEPTDQETLLTWTTGRVCCRRSLIESDPLHLAQVKALQSALYFLPVAHYHDEHLARHEVLPGNSLHILVGDAMLEMLSTFAGSLL